MNWNDYSSTPLYQQSDDAEKQNLRYRYWKDYLAPNIPTEHHRDARRMFDEHTASRENVDSSYLGDLLINAPLHGAYAGSADLVSGASRLVGGDGYNTVSEWLRKKSEDELDEMSPSSVEAMQGFGVESKAGGGYGLTDNSTASA